LGKFSKGAHLTENMFFTLNVLVLLWLPRFGDEESHFGFVHFAEQGAGIQCWEI
jgi:hypothetical protein